MTQQDFVSMLRVATSVPNYYRNEYPYNLGYYDGVKYIFDCSGLVKSILCGWKPGGAVGSFTKMLPGMDLSAAQLISRCSSVSQDFSRLSVPGTYLYGCRDSSGAMHNHAGVYVGEIYVDGQLRNVIECTKSSTIGVGVVYSWVDPDGSRRPYKGSSAKVYNWTDWGLLTEWVEYSGYSGDLNNAAEFMADGHAFVPRSSAPSVNAKLPFTYETQTEKVYDKKKKKYVTKSTQVIKYDGRDMWYAPDGWGLPQLNMVSYVWDRFSEIMEEDPNNLLIEHFQGCNLSRGMAADVYKHSEDGYARNVACSLGAVMCFYNRKNPSDGLVCIVENMNSDGSVDTSEWVNGRFSITHREKRYGFWDSGDYVFQGFIHNPAVCTAAMATSALESFCQIAEEHVNDNISWIQSKVPSLQSNESPSAAFIAAVAATSGSVLNIVIPNTKSVSAIGSSGVLNNMGEWIDGPANGGYGNAEVGDIIVIRNNYYKKPGKYQGDQAGIVVTNNGDFVDMISATIDGISKKSISIRSNRVAGFFRPKWQQIDGTSDSVKLYRNLHGLYTEGTTAQDACAREIGYISPTYQPSISKSGIRLSAINYTGLLANMYSVFATSSTSDAADANLIVDLWTNTIQSYFQPGGVRLADGAESVLVMTGDSLVPSADTTITESIAAAPVNVTQNARICFDYLISQGFNEAVTCGILGNIKRESGFNGGAVGDHGTSFGLCQWHNNRGDAMKAVAGVNWQTNLTGQLDYLISELNGSERTTGNALKLVVNTREGCQQAADIFVRKFERPANVDYESTKYRQPYALGFWENLVS